MITINEQVAAKKDSLSESLGRLSGTIRNLHEKVFGPVPTNEAKELVSGSIVEQSIERMNKLTAIVNEITNGLPL